jgi:hypothetical protein
MSTFDIFSGRIDDEATQVETVEGFGNAYDLMTKIAAKYPGPYFIVSRKSHTVCGSIDTSIRSGAMRLPQFGGSSLI